MKQSKSRAIGLVADSHFDETSRFDECIRVHRWIAEDGARRGVSLWLHAGDIFERKSTPAERRAVAEWLAELAETAPVLIVRGNHDAVGDLAIFSRLRTRHPILVEETCGVHVCAGIAVGCMAWPRKGELLARLHDAERAARLGPGASRDHVAQVASDALRAVLRGLGDAMAAHEGPRVLLAHALVTGAKTSCGQPLVGHDMEMALGDLALARADFIALGHVHKAQEWPWQLDDGAELPIVYSGSPRRTAFGEIEPKGYVVAHFDGQRLSHWERVETPARPMLLLEGSFSEVDGAGPELVVGEIEGERLMGAEVRLRYDVEADQRAAARKAAEAWKRRALKTGHAIDVKLEEVVRPKTRARAPELAKAPTLPEQLRAFWAVRRPDLPPARRERFLSLVSELEAEAK